MQNLSVTEYGGARVLTSKQLAEAYGTTPDVIGYNYRYNKERYKEGKHYIMLEKQALREYKITNVEIQRSLPKISKLYLWTEKGALLHAKSLNTDKAWEVYDYLVDFYFRAKESGKTLVTVEAKQAQKTVSKTALTTVVDVPENPKILKAIEKVQEDLICMKVLLEECKRYSSEETYKERRKAVTNVIRIINGDWNTLLDLQPKLIQKQY